MEIDQIVRQLKGERDRLTKAIDALEGSGGSTTASVGRPAGSTGRRGRRSMSPAARKRISEMMKKRWAERRKGAGKKSAA